LGEAWVEELVDDDYFLVWLPKRTKLGRNRLCVNVPRYEGGGIELDKLRTKYAGEVFHHVLDLAVGELPTIESKVAFQRYGRGRDTELGIVTLRPVRERQ